MKMNQKTIKKLIRNQKLRSEITRKSHLWFFHVYLHEHVKYPIAPFQKEMFAISEDEKIDFAAICSFRESAKSTIFSLSYPIWSILGKPGKKFIVLVSQTSEQAKQHFKNIKDELETNDLLKQDLGPFEQQDEWNNCSLIIPKYNAKIIAVSRDQSFRGLKFHQHRPDLLVIDDCEDNKAVKTKESRRNTRQWFTSEVLPLGSNNAKVIVVGNLIHRDSLLMNLKENILAGKRNGIYREYPLLDENDNIAWPGMYPDMKAIEKKRLDIGNKFAWAREYLLKIIDDSEPIVNPKWIQYYDKLPKELPGETIEYVMGVDLAISEKDKSDFTAIVCAKVYGYGDKRRIYILPNPINEHMTLKKTQNIIENLIASYGGKYTTKIAVENSSLEIALKQLMSEEQYRIKCLKIGNMDKSERLNVASSPIQSGKVFFSRIGNEDLLDQILDFRMTKHDDLVDGFTALILKILESNNAQEFGTMKCIGMYRKIM